MKKLHSFTLVEMIVSMMLSSIIIGIVYYSFLFFSGQIGRVRLSKKQYSEFRLLKKGLSHDFKNALAITDSANLVIICINSSGQTRYYFGDSAVTRYTNENVTRFDLSQVKYQPEYMKDIPKLLNSIEITLRNKSTELNFAINKIYSASDILNLELYISE
jgi:prepilin-type N-terminal cleavage/methylation domain-containing protein